MDDDNPQLSHIQIKDLVQGSMFLTSEQIDDMLQKAGAQGCIIVLTDSKMPCPESLTGVGCSKPHQISVFAKNIDQDYANTFLSLLRDIMRHTPPKFY